MDKRYLTKGVGLLLALALSLPALAVSKQELSSKAMNPQLPKAERVDAIKALYSDMLAGQDTPKRKICVWDIVGRSGPIFAAAKDQQMQLLEMGINIELDAYTSEGVLVGQADKFPPEIAQLVREDFYARFNDMEEMVERQTGDIPESVWVDIPDEDKAGYQHVMQEARIKLRNNNYYDGDMLTLERKIRCKFEPSHAECTNPVE